MATIDPTNSSINSYASIEKDESASVLKGGYAIVKEGGVAEVFEEGFVIVKRGGSASVLKGGYAIIDDGGRVNVQEGGFAYAWLEGRALVYNSREHLMNVTARLLDALCLQTGITGMFSIHKDNPALTEAISLREEWKTLKSLGIFPRKGRKK